MQETILDLPRWAAQAAGRVMVCPTNLVLRKSGSAVMGAGLAKDTRDAFSQHDLEGEYGERLREASSVIAARAKLPTPSQPTELGEHAWHGRVFLSARAPVLYVPTKLHFADPSPLELLESNLAALSQVIASMNWKTFGVPLLGAGLGGLDPEKAKALIKQHLDLPNVVLALPPTAKAAVPEQIARFLASRRVLVVTGHRPNKLGGYSPQSAALS